MERKSGRAAAPPVRGLRYAPPALLLAVFTAVALAYAVGGWETYQAVVQRTVMDPVAFPFLDTHALLSAVECHRLGFDVIQINPCDLLGRPHVYSPLWLSLAYTGANTQWTLLVGSLICLTFIASLFFLPPPVRNWDVLWVTVATLSPAVIFALERANNDLIVFVIALLAARASTGGVWARAAAYGLAVVGGMLKFYPTVLLILAARERNASRCIVVVMAGLAVIGTYFLLEAEHLIGALAITPDADATAASLGVKNLSAGLARFAPNWPLARAALVAAITLFCVAVFVRLLYIYVLRARSMPLTVLEATCLLAGGSLLVGCFLTASSAAYRGVFLLLVLPGLLRLGHERRELASVAIVAALLPWIWVLPIPRHGDDLAPLGWAIWVMSQVLWWWLITVLAALVCAVVAVTPVGSSVRARLVDGASAWLPLVRKNQRS